MLGDRGVVYAIHVVCLVIGVTACANRPPPAPTFHQVLDLITHVGTPLYTQTVADCDHAEGRAIEVNLSGAAAEQEVWHIRQQCDRIFGAFDDLRKAQELARSAADTVEDQGGWTRAVDLALSANEAYRRAHRLREAARALVPVLVESRR